MKELTLVLLGDVFMTTRLSRWGDPAFLELVSIIRNADVSFANLEVLINDFRGTPAAYSGGTYAAARSFVADELKWMGIDMVSRANNHAMDYGVEGMVETSRNLDRVGIAHAGVGMCLGEARAPVYMDVAGLRVSMISAATSFPPGAEAGEARPDAPGRPGVNPIHVKTIYEVTPENAAALRDIAGSLGIEIPTETDEFYLFNTLFRVRDRNRVVMEPSRRDVEANLRQVSSASRQSDIVIFSLHSHQVVGRDPKRTPGFLRELAHRIVDTGATVFVGHGPHVLRGIEVYRGRPILYSLGNFVFQNDLVEKQPADLYYRVGLGLEDSVADLYDARERGTREMRLRGFEWFTKKWEYWVTVAAELFIDADGEVKRLRLYPVELTWKVPRSRRGRPRLAKGRAALEILGLVERLSRELGTEIRVKEGVGEVVL